MSISIDGVDRLEIQEGVADPPAPVGEGLDPATDERLIPVAKGSFAMAFDPQLTVSSNWRRRLLTLV
jgi:hypothetical protein